MAGSIGLRVVRGPDWKWANQDGGEGTVGTVVATQLPKVTNVRWDTGVTANYRSGAESAYDLRVFDNAQCGVRHAGISCSHCNEVDIPGMRWQCEKCNIDLCSACYMADMHDVTHGFRRFTTPLSSAVTVPLRSNSSKQNARGIFPETTVVRGPDWKWGAQDGGKGKEGTVMEQINWSRTTCRDGVRVQWQAGTSCLYRLGHDGKVDLLQKVTGTGCRYYPEHLPVLGKVAEQATLGKVTGASPSLAGSASNSAPDTLVDGPLMPGDEVVIELDSSILEVIQRGHGGWTLAMNDLIGKMGRVQQLAPNGDIIVEYEPKRRFAFHPAALRKVATS